MTEEELNKLKFPIGKFIKPEILTKDLLNKYISEIELFPSRLKAEVITLSGSQLDTQYRPEGWTIRQVVNHCADSHMNSLTRFKLTLTEDNPVVKPYYEERWAELADSKFIAILPALLMLEGIHIRWTILLKALDEKDLAKSFIHPEHGKEFRLDENIGVYAWHCNHHLAHIITLKNQKSWV